MIERRELLLHQVRSMIFFKYVTADTAKVVLETGKLRWSSPSQFNDPFDVQFDLHVEFDEAKIIDLIVDELWRIYSRRKELEPANALGKVFELFLTRVPGLSRNDIFERQGLREAIAESIKRTVTFLPSLHAHQRALLKGDKLLCLSEVHDNILMCPIMLATTAVPSLSLTVRRTNKARYRELRKSSILRPCHV
jgi:hypothetical protein